MLVLDVVWRMQKILKLDSMHRSVIYPLLLHIHLLTGGGERVILHHPELLNLGLSHPLYSFSMWLFFFPVFLFFSFPLAMPSFNIQYSPVRSSILVMLSRDQNTSATSINHVPNVCKVYAWSFTGTWGCTQ